MTAPVNGESYNSCNCVESEAQGQAELMRGGEMVKLPMLTMTGKQEAARSG